MLRRRSKKPSTRQRCVLQPLLVPPISITTNNVIASDQGEYGGNGRADRVIVLQVKDKVSSAKKRLDQALDGVLLAVDKAQKFAEKVDR